LARAGAAERLFAHFDALLRTKGWLAMGGQIVDATVIEARRPRLTQAEKATIKGGGVPAQWPPARRAQIDRDGRWTIKRGKKREVPPGGQPRQVEIAVPVFGYKNHVGIDREHGFLRRYSITHAAAHDGGQLGAVLDRDNTASDVWADIAYRSAANLALLDRRALKPQFQRKKPRADRCRLTSPVATPPEPACARASSMSSPRRNAGSASSSAPSAWCALASRSAWPISPTTSPGWPGSTGEPRGRDRTAHQ
jgi:Transposase DDE domain